MITMTAPMTPTVTAPCIDNDDRRDVDDDVSGAGELPGHGYSIGGHRASTGTDVHVSVNPERVTEPSDTHRNTICSPFDTYVPASRRAPDRAAIGVTVARPSNNDSTSYRDSVSKKVSVSETAKPGRAVSTHVHSSLLLYALPDDG
jgi:hypothetical protein